MNPLKKNDEGSDDPEYDPKVHHYWKQLQKLFLLLWKTIVWTLCPLSKYHEWPFKSTLQISTSTSKNENKIYVHCFVKVNVSKKATQIDKIFTVYLTFTTWCQIIGEDFITLCGLLRKNELYPTSFNEWSLLFFQGEEYFAHRLWKIVAALSLSMEFSSRREQPFTRFQSNHVWEIWSSAILMIKAHKMSPIFFCNDHMINDT